MTAVSTLRSLFENKIFLCTILSMAIAQVLKLFFYLINNKNKKKLDAIETVIWRTGGMPSSHSALVCSLATATGIQEGISSTYFIISLLFALVVLRDSVGVRRASGLQARAINNLGKQLSKVTGQDFHSVKEIHGHTPLEVLVGSCLGILIAVIFFII
ncbi:MAG: divergent PAP2 family protein [Treponema sp.]|nr:divergent PAP2 family protein [Treponema sp.]